TDEDERSTSIKPKMITGRHGTDHNQTDSCEAQLCVDRKPTLAVAGRYGRLRRACDQSGARRTVQEDAVAAVAVHVDSVERGFDTRLSSAGRMDVNPVCAVFSHQRVRDRQVVTV